MVGEEHFVFFVELNLIDCFELAWWRAHHFISTVATGILLTWPESHSYHAFRTQFFIFSFYLSFVQVKSQKQKHFLFHS